MQMTRLRILLALSRRHAYLETRAPLKGLGNIVQMRENGAKAVTSMLDVQLKIIWKFEWKRTIINDTNREKLIWSIPKFRA